MPGLGLDYATLEKINPGLVMTSISNFGQTGPYRDFKASEIILYGMGGAMSTTGLGDCEPVKKGMNVIQHQGGAMAASATMIAFFGARAQGAGQHVDVSLFETQMSAIDRRMSELLAYEYNNELTPRMDIAGLIAPRPLLLEMGVHDTCFPIEHTLKGYEGVKKIYKAAGAEERLWADIHPGPHAFAANKAFDFFRKYL